MIGSVAVVIPARDEQALLAACLDSVRRAADALPIEVAVAIVVAQDSCADATAEIVADQAMADPRVVTVAGTWGSAGAARRAGVEEAQHRLRHTPEDRTWLAATDADTVVPPAWLIQQLDLADEGWDAVVGVVDLAADDPLRSRFRARYPLTPGRPHTYVHGANLGLRASTYRQVGGWPTEHEVGEDQRLWDAVQLGGHHALATTELVVQTSARRTSRVVDGFAARLRDLEAVPQPRAPAEGAA